MNIENTLEENLKHSYLKGESKGFMQAFSFMLFIMFIMVAYFIQYRNNVEYDKKVNHYLYDKIASDCQVKIDSMMEVGSFVLPKK